MTSFDRQFGETAVEGSALAAGAITIDSIGNLYIVTEPAAFDEEFGTEVIGRRDFVDGIPVGRTYFVDAASRFMVFAS